MTAPADSALLDRFHHPDYLRHNARRLEHLASLGLSLRNRNVLEIGAGIGDLSSFFLDRSCALTITEPREDSMDYLRRRYPDVRIQQLDLDSPAEPSPEAHEVVFCYGVLYHLAGPERALHRLRALTRDILLLETCVSPGNEEAEHRVQESSVNPTEATSGWGCRPTRPWIFSRLSRLFPQVYQPITQPAHPELPLDWSTVAAGRILCRAIFAAFLPPHGESAPGRRFAGQTRSHPLTGRMRLGR